MVSNFMAIPLIDVETFHSVVISNVNFMAPKEGVSGIQLMNM